MGYLKNMVDQKEMQMSNEERLKALGTRLKNFDWFYMYSDDSYVNRSGDAAKAELELESTQLRKLGFKEEVDALWMQHRPRM
jgi:hypothetical protein